MDRGRGDERTSNDMVIKLLHLFPIVSYKFPSPSDQSDSLKLCSPVGACSHVEVVHVWCSGSCQTAKSEARTKSQCSLQTQ